jgi:hypothetical protein
MIRRGAAGAMLRALFRVAGYYPCRNSYVSITTVLPLPLALALLLSVDAAAMGDMMPGVGSSPEADHFAAALLTLPKVLSVFGGFDTS